MGGSADDGKLVPNTNLEIGYQLLNENQDEDQPLKRSPEKREEEIDRETEESTRDSEYDDEDGDSNEGKVDVECGKNGSSEEESDGDFDEDSEAIESIDCHSSHLEESEDEEKLLNRDAEGYNAPSFSLTPDHDHNEVTFHEFHGDTETDSEEDDCEE